MPQPRESQIKQYLTKVCINILINGVFYDYQGVGNNFLLLEILKNCLTQFQHCVLMHLAASLVQNRHHAVTGSCQIEQLPIEMILCSLKEVNMLKQIVIETDPHSTAGILICE